ncbi:MAG: T9SS type A sorting domain-containing protein [Bacteroidales bacterium]|nr:T9SS type A sorting domain-containing protein [Bacteroidales bacterium]MDD4684240.1 T9SS type A sorting domain-containing protein [Bacteroidales bacterium]
MKTHVYKLVLGLLLTLFALNINAQDYEYIPMVKPGVQIWTDDFVECSGHYLFRRFALTEEDTIIESETYKKLYFFTDNVFDSSTAECIGGLRENEQKQVYYKGGSIPGGVINSGLMFDFSLSIGDTFFCYYPFSLTFQVKSIDTIDYAGSLRKKFTLGLQGDTSSSPYVVAQIIEGIGNTQGLMYDMSWNLTVCDFWGKNRCYEHNGVLLFHNYSSTVEDCITPLVGLNEIKLEDNSIVLYPNPANNQVNISSENIINSIEVFNSLGQSVYKSNIKSREKIIDINSLSKGVYIIGVNTDKGYIKKKLIKN